MAQTASAASSVNFAKLSDDELFTQRNDAVEHFSAIEQEVDARRKRGEYLIKQVHNIPWVPVSEMFTSLKAPIKWKPLITPTHGFPVHNFYSFLIQVPANYRQSKYHIHGEAIKFYLKGKGIEHIGDKTYEVEAGDVILIPANEWHGTENPNNEPIEFYGVQMLDGTYLQKPALIASAKS